MNRLTPTQADLAQKLLDSPGFDVRGVHLQQQLVEHAGAATKHAAHAAAHAAAGCAQGVDLVDEQDTGTVFRRFFASLAIEAHDAQVANAEEHVLEARRRGVAERHVGLGRNGLGQV